MRNHLGLFIWISRRYNLCIGELRIIRMKKSLRTSFWGVLFVHLLGILLYLIIFVVMPKSVRTETFRIELFNVFVCTSLLIAFCWQFHLVYGFLSRIKHHLPVHYLNMILITLSLSYFTVVQFVFLLDEGTSASAVIFQPVPEWSYILFIITLFQGTITYLINLKLVSSMIKRLRDKPTRKVYYRFYQNPMVNTIIGITVFLVGYSIVGYIQKSFGYLLEIS